MFHRERFITMKQCFQLNQRMDHTLISNEFSLRQTHELPAVKTSLYLRERNSQAKITDEAL